MLVFNYLFLPFIFYNQILQHLTSAVLVPSPPFLAFSALSKFTLTHLIWDQCSSVFELLKSLETHPEAKWTMTSSSG